jgi:hypothetical protein
MRDASIYYILGALVVSLLAFLTFRSRRTTPRGRASGGGDQLLADLRSDLLTKMGHDFDAVDRIVNGLRRKHQENHSHLSTSVQSKTG